MRKTIATFIILLFSLMSIGQTKNEDILKFMFEYHQDKLDSTIYHVDAKIINTSNEPVYFLSESCNGLDYYINTGSSDIEVYITLHCNTTLPLKNVIDANSEYVFKTTLKGNKNGKILLELNLVILYSDSIVIGKSINDIKKEYASHVFKLKASAN